MNIFSLRWSIYCGLAFTVFLGVVADFTRAFAFFGFVFYVGYLTVDTINIAAKMRQKGIREPMSAAVLANSMDIFLTVFTLFVGLYMGIS